MAICPLISNDKLKAECGEDCALWCPGDKACAIKVIALELIKQGENGV